MQDFTRFFVHLNDADKRRGKVAFFGHGITEENLLTPGNRCPDTPGMTRGRQASSQSRRGGVWCRHDVIHLSEVRDRARYKMLHFGYIFFPDINVLNQHNIALSVNCFSLFEIKVCLEKVNYYLHGQCVWVLCRCLETGGRCHLAIKIRGIAYYEQEDTFNLCTYGSTITCSIIIKDHHAFPQAASHSLAVMFHC